MQAPRHSAHRRLEQTLVFALALSLGGSLWSQSGSVQIELHSLDAVTDPSAYPYFSELSVMPIAEDSQAAVDYILLQRFKTFYDTLDDGETDELNETEVVNTAEYTAYHSGQDAVRESGLLAFKIAEQATADLTGDNVVGFFRSTSVPSALPTTPAPGYFDGAAGNLVWDFRASSRGAYVELSGAHFDPTEVFADLTTLSTANNIATLNGLSFPIDGTDDLAWRFANVSLRPFEDRTIFRRTDLHYGFVNRADGLLTEDLAGIVDPTSDADRFVNRVYLATVVDDQDTDGDRVPDWIDLTNELAALPVYAEFGSSGSDWYWTDMLSDWVYSTRATPWDYSNKLGWIYPPSSSDRRNFWFYQHSGSQGWLWTSAAHFPALYRHQDNSWVYLLTSQTPNTALIYNFSTGQVETIAL